MSFYGGGRNRSAASDFVDRDPYEYQRPTQGHVPSRPVASESAEKELASNVKKATSTDETAPKQKHVRKIILFTWDFHTSESIWRELRAAPILSDEVQTFKALITVHKLLQEGHPRVLKDAQKERQWIETCARTMGNESARGYGTLIRAYVKFVLAKLSFHRHHDAFNGQFEYEEYISLKGTHDPNEGYETLSDLMNLQDHIDQFQKLIFAHFRGSTNNECKISALVPLVKESYGIYRFIVSMMRAMHRNADQEALEPLRGRFRAQHYNLRKFYYECSNLKYLTGLINVPKLPQEPPNLMQFDDDAPSLPRRPVKSPTPPPAAPRTPAPDLAEQARMLKEFEDQRAEQDRLKAEREAEQRRLAEERDRQASEFEDMQRRQAEEQRLAQERLLQQQMAAQAGGRVAELEREIMAMRGQYERDQMMLEQYDRRVKSLETDLGMMNANINASLSSKDEMVKSLQDQVTLWKNKYEQLAKLYSQLRGEHLDMLAKFKQMQLKANSAQEAVDKMERMERDMKNKNLELADMIRERDRARFEVDRMKAGHKDEAERLRRDLRFAEERAEDATRNKSSEVSTLLAKYNRQMNELEDSLRVKQDRIDELLRKLQDHSEEMSRLSESKDREIEIANEATEQALSALQTGKVDDDALNAQIDVLLLDQRKKLFAIIDSILQACAQKVDDAIYELESPLQVGNQAATPEYTLSLIERAQTSATEFATVFSLHVEEQSGGEHVEVIKKANDLAQSIVDVLINTKGISQYAGEDDAKVEQLIKAGKTPGDVVIRFFNSVESYRRATLSVQQQGNVIVQQSSNTRDSLGKLASYIEQIIPKQTSNLAKANGDIGDLVEAEMSAAARAIEAATERLQLLMSRPRTSGRSAVELSVHDAILQAALAITNAIGRLIKAATDSQQEIVRAGRGSSTSQAFYKKNNRWTEGLISASKAVAFATTLLIETADGVISGTHTLEQLIVASNEVAAATAQLVQASRVKANFMSKTQEQLELAAKAVTDACKALVRQVKAITQKQLQGQDDANYGAMGQHEFKRVEMEAQVAIVTLEKELTEARRKLATMRKAAYHSDETAI